MKPIFRRVAVIGKYPGPGAVSASDSARQIIESIAQFVTQQDCELTLEAETAAHTGLTQYHTLDVEGIGRQCDLCLVVGGDGTMLGVGRRLAGYGTPLVGINQGRLGFITDIPLEGYPSGMVELRVEVDGVFVSNQRADGLIVASPTGSTAYALSAGGPMLHPSIPGWVLVPIAPHTLSNRPIVLSDATEVAIEVAGGRDISANFDMQSLASLQHGDRILVRRSAHRVCFLHPRGWSYFATLRKKLGWYEGGS